MAKHSELDRLGLKAALEQARKSYSEGGIPIGSAIVGTSSLEILGVGHNQRIQKESPILHGETAALDAAGRLKAEIYRGATIFTTLSMCTGAILLYNIPRVVIGENVTFKGEEDLLKSRGVEVVVLDDPECKELMQKFIKAKPEDWYEDIGEPAAR
ncbi:hypothetical protein HWV62_21162 [Athelia sp. TMB]|nr:hypothetical protein HWV62_21162 [Athelia sp. TMB]